MWDERYAVDDYVYGKQPNDFLREHHARLSGKRVLCLAEGEGRNAVFLAQQGYEVCAIDTSAVAKEKALKLADEYGVSIDYQVADLDTFDLGEQQWDGVVSIFCHLASSVRASLHRRVARALRSGGVLLLEAYTPAQLLNGTGGPPSADMMMTGQQLREELSGLSFELLQEIQREVKEGRYHCGLGDVVQVISRSPVAVY